MITNRMVENVSKNLLRCISVMSQQFDKFQQLATINPIYIYTSEKLRFYFGEKYLLIIFHFILLFIIIIYKH